MLHFPLNNEPYIKYKNYLLENKNYQEISQNRRHLEACNIKSLGYPEPFRLQEGHFLAFSRRPSLSSFEESEPAPVLSNVDRDLA